MSVTTATNPFKQARIPSVSSRMPATAWPTLSNHATTRSHGRLFRAIISFALVILLIGGVIGWRVTHPEKTASASPPQTRAPLNAGYLSSPYGPRWGRMHQGVDVAVRPGTPIHPIKPGTVVHSGWEGGYGLSVVVDHGRGLMTRYAHCSKLLVRTGDTVTHATTLGLVGSTGSSTGPHLHFELLKDGRHKNPAYYIDFMHLNQPTAPVVAVHPRPAAWPTWLAGMRLTDRAYYAH